MKKIILLILFCVVFQGCMTTSIPGFCAFQTDPGVRVFKTPNRTIVHITYKPGDTPPEYAAIAPILDGVFD